MESIVEQQRFIGVKQQHTALMLLLLLKYTVLKHVSKIFNPTVRQQNFLLVKAALLISVLTVTIRSRIKDKKTQSLRNPLSNSYEGEKGGKK